MMSLQSDLSGLSFTMLSLLHTTLLQAASSSYTYFKCFNILSLWYLAVQFQMHSGCLYMHLKGTAAKKTTTKKQQQKNIYTDNISLQNSVIIYSPSSCFKPVW